MGISVASAVGDSAKDAEVVGAGEVVGGSGLRW